jgi:hypothetical protein
LVPILPDREEHLLGDSCPRPEIGRRQGRKSRAETFSKRSPKLGMLLERRDGMLADVVKE